ncbi:MAG: EF-hand domain-containing protein [Steroidobacteraceae bacterium]
MRKVFLGIGALALICIAGFVTAQASPQDQAAPSSQQTSPEATANTASQPDQGTKMRLARMDTSVAAFRKLDTDNDGRISALEAADNSRVATAFTMADKDKDGYLSKEEFAAMGAGAAHPSDDASSPSGDHASEPGGDQSATAPNEPSSSSAEAPPRATPRQKR